MPFDGMNFAVLDETEIGIAQPSRRCAWRPWRKVIGLWRSPEPARRPDRPDEIAHMLADARALIADEGEWVQGAFWRFPNRRCAMGALRFVARRYKNPGVAVSAYAALAEVARARGFQSVERMNDASVHGEVITAFEAAIAAVREHARC